jgi:hypothetical protein
VAEGLAAQLAHERFDDALDVVIVAVGDRADDAALAATSVALPAGRDGL